METETATRTEQKKPIQSFEDLEVYQLGFELAMTIYSMTKNFPKEELYSLTTQMRNASRSVPANIAEGWAKREYTAVFKRHLLDALGSANEMLVWVDIALKCEYLKKEDSLELNENYRSLAKRLHQLHANWRKF